MKSDILKLVLRALDDHTDPQSVSDRETAAKLARVRLADVETKGLKLWIGDSTGSPTDIAGMFKHYTDDIAELTEKVQKLTKTNDELKQRRVSTRQSELERTVEQQAVDLVGLREANEKLMAQLAAKVATPRPKRPESIDDVPRERLLEIRLKSFEKAFNLPVCDEAETEMEKNGWTDAAPMTPEELAFHGQRLWGDEWVLIGENMAPVLGIRDMHHYYRNHKGNVWEPRPDWMKIILRRITKENLAHFTKGTLSKKKEPVKSRKKDV